MTHLRHGARGARMKTENGKIIEATKTELYHYWLTGDWDEFVSFPDFMFYMEQAGVTVKEEEDNG